MTPWAAVGEILRIVRLWLELKVRRQLLDELEKSERESDELGDRYEDAFKVARNTGSIQLLADAERLRVQRARRLKLGSFITTGLSGIEGRDPGAGASRNLHSTSTRDLDIRTDPPETAGREQ